MALITKIENNNVKPVEKAQEVKSTEEIMKEKELTWLSVLEDSEINKKFCLVVGARDEYDNSDSTGKTGIVLDEIARQLRKDKDAKAYFIDIDDGLRNLAKFHSDVIPRIYTYKPLQLTIKEGVTSIDYMQTMNEIRMLVSYLWQNYKKLNIKSVVFDGLTTYLGWCADQMKEDKYITPDGTFNMKYWQIRNKYFFETMQILKQLPIDVYLIGHDNFLNFDQEAVINGVKVKLGNLQKNLNNMIQQRIICSKHKDEKGNRVLRATIDKSKGAALKEEQVYEFMNIVGGKVVFDSIKVFEGL